MKVDYAPFLGIALGILGVLGLLQLHRKRRIVPSATAFYRRRDLAIAGAVLAPVSAVVATVLFIALAETWSLANVVTVYGGLFGIAAAGYSMWRM